MTFIAPILTLLVATTVLVTRYDLHPLGLHSGTNDLQIFLFGFSRVRSGTDDSC